MRILHISDQHGIFPNLLGNFDVVLMTGDFYPDFPGRPINSNKFQYEWLESKILLMKQWLKNKPFLFCLGNHDYVNADMMATFLNSEGIKAFNLHDEITTIDNVNFYGFPYVPAINGSFSYETSEGDMVKFVDEMVSKINQTYTDVIAAHAPIYGCLDKHNGQSIGNLSMATALDYKIKEDMMPVAYLHGHIHSSNGVMNRNGLLVSNAATSQNIIEI